MNFFGILEELDHLYETVDSEQDLSKEEPTLTAEETEASEYTEDEEIEIEILDDEESEEELKQVIECSACGGVSIVAKEELTPELECHYCDKTGEFKVLGELIPAEDAEEVPVEESTEEAPTENPAEEEAPVEEPEEEVDDESKEED